MCTSDLEHLRSNGELFGYPECCIQNFMDNFRVPLEDIAVVRLTREHPSVAKFLEGSGFVPCPSCASKIEEKGFSTFFWEHIAPNRKISLKEIQYWVAET